MVAAVEKVEDFKMELDLLSRFGVAPVHGELDVEWVARALTSLKGWELEVKKVKGEWRARVVHWVTVSQSKSSVAYDTDKSKAILKAIRLALSWRSQQEEFEEFDRSVQSLLKIGGAEFLEKWHRNELDLDDPLVSHLLIIRPLGY